MAVRKKKLTEKQLETLRRNGLKRKSWKKGQTGNPKGSSTKLRAIAFVKKLEVEEFKQIVGTIMSCGLEELERMSEDTTIPILRKWIAGCILKADRDATPAILWPFMDRLHGTPKQSMDVNNSGSTTAVVVQLPPKKPIDEHG